MGSDGSSAEKPELNSGKLLRLLKQQHVAWTAVGFGAATAKASVRGIALNLEAENSVILNTFLIVADPWSMARLRFTISRFSPCYLNFVLSLRQQLAFLTFLTLKR